MVEIPWAKQSSLLDVDDFTKVTEVGLKDQENTLNSTLDNHTYINTKYITYTLNQAGIEATTRGSESRATTNYNTNG